MSNRSFLGLLLFCCFVLCFSCLAQPSTVGLPCQSDEDCLGTICFRSVCAGHTLEHSESYTDRPITEKTPEESSSSEHLPEHQSPEEVVPESHPSEAVEGLGEQRLAEKEEQSPTEQGDAAVNEPSSPELSEPVTPEKSTSESIPEPFPIPEGAPKQQKWNTVQKVSGPYFNKGEGIKVRADNKGNLYFAGPFLGTLTLGKHSIKNKSGTDTFVAKMDKAGNWLWLAHATGNHVVTNDLALDKSGNVYIVGSFQGLAEFDSTVLAFKGGADLFVAKLDSTGSWLWAKQAGNKRSEAAIGIAVDSKGHIYITGSFDNDFAFDKHALKYTGSYGSGFVAKLDKSGKWAWAKAMNGYSIRGVRVVIDSKDAVYVMGEAAGQFSLDGITTKKPVGGHRRTFVLKFDVTGKLQWIRQEHHTKGGKSFCVDMAISPNDEIYVVGNFLGELGFGKHNLSQLGGPGQDDAFVAKLSTKGDWMWARHVGSAFDEHIWAVDVDRWGQVYIVGYFNGIATIGGNTHKSVGKRDLFAASLSSAGQWRWVQVAGSTEEDYAHNVVVDVFGTLYVLGHFGGNGSFGSVKYASGRGSFIAKLKQ